MKNLLIVIILIVSTMAYGQKETNDLFTVKVDGLGCAFCAVGLEKSLQKNKGIENIKIELETGTLTFETAHTRRLQSADVVELVEKAGYTPVNFRVKRADGKEEREEFAEKK